MTCEGVWVPCPASLVSCKSQGCTLVLCGVNENRSDKLVLMCFVTTAKHRWVCYIDFVKVKAGVSKSVTVISRKGQTQDLCNLLV